MDIGQPGSARLASHSAKFVLHVFESPAEVTTVPQKVPQQNLAFVDNMGFDSGAAEWRGTLFVKDEATMGAIFSDLDRFKHGSSRISGIMTAPLLNFIRPTRLTNLSGRILSESATVEDWRTDGRVMRINTPNSLYLYAVGLMVKFRLLG